MRNSSVLLLFFCMITSLISAQNTSDVFLSLGEKKDVKIYSTSSKRKVIKMLKHDFINEDYLLFTIHESNDSMYRITASYAISGKSVKGWITKKTKIAINSKQESQLKLYKSPNKTKEPFLLKIAEKELAVIDCKGSWLKVIAIEGKSKKIGWLSREAQCGNPYTTCN